MDSFSQLSLKGQVHKTDTYNWCLGCLSSLLLVDSVFIRRTPWHSTGPKGVRVWERWVCLNEYFLDTQPPSLPPKWSKRLDLCVMYIQRSVKDNSPFYIGFFCANNVPFVKFYLRLSSDYGTFTKRSSSFIEILHQTTSCWEKMIKSL